MAATTGSVMVLDQCRVTPPLATSPPQMSLPLTFLDIGWLYSQMEGLFFFDIPQLSKSQFVDDLMPKLKHSLSLTLKHFLPLAGNLIVPPNLGSAMPEIRYTRGDSVALVFSECNSIDFNLLVANYERDCDDFYPLIPELKSSSLHDDDFGAVVSTTPTTALQVTLFPNMGLSIGIANHHTVGDASSVLHFMKTWGILHNELSSQDNDVDVESVLVRESLPVFDKTLIKDTKGLARITWEQSKSFNFEPEKDTTSKLTTKPNKVRKTFVFSPKDVQKLKSFVLKKGEKFVHLSSFTVICAYVWTCLVKSQLASQGETVSDALGGNENLIFAANCRERSDPPIPANYFGNCLTPCLTAAKTEQLVGEEGLQIAVELIGRTIHEKFQLKDALYNGAEAIPEIFKNLNWDKTLTVSGATKFNFYKMDFGWGHPIKFEIISIDKTGDISMSGSRGSEGNVEIGISLTKPEMDAFSTVFMEGFNAF